MDKAKHDKATLYTLVQKLNENNIPRMQRMLKRLDEEEKLTDQDIGHLKREYDTNMKDWRLIERNPDYMDLGLRYVDLYLSVISKAMENEQIG
jgi:hypothetical protein